MENASEIQVKAIYDRLIAFVENVTHDLYRLNIERLRKLNPTLEELALLCEQMIELLEAAGQSKIADLSDVVRVLREAALVVQQAGDERTLTDCAYHIEETLRMHRVQHA